MQLKWDRDVPATARSHCSNGLEDRLISIYTPVTNCIRHAKSPLYYVSICPHRSVNLCFRLNRETRRCFRSWDVSVCRPLRDNVDEAISYWEIGTSLCTPLFHGSLHFIVLSTRDSTLFGHLFSQFVLWENAAI